MFSYQLRILVKILVSRKGTSSPFDKRDLVENISQIKNFGLAPSLFWDAMFSEKYVIQYTIHSKATAGSFIFLVE